MNLHSHAAWRCALSLLLPFLLTLTSHAQSGEPLSARLGAAIDTNARAYFGLFPTIAGFRSASAVTTGDGSSRFAISRDRGGDTTLTLDAEATADLRRYIESYESLFASDTMSIDWERLKEIVRPLRPYTHRPMTLHVTLDGGERVTGTLMAAEEDFILLLPDPVIPDWRTLAGRCRFIDVDAIMRVEDDGGFVEDLVYDLDIPVRGNDTIYRRYVYPDLRGRGLFVAYRAPEIERLIASHTRSSRSAAAASVADILDARRPARLVLWISPALALGREERTIGLVQNSPQSTFRSTEDFTAYAETRSWSAGLEFDVLRWLRVGGAYAVRSAPEAVADTTTNYQQIHGTEWEGFARVLLLSRGDFLRTFVDRVELSLGIGMLFGDYTVDSRLVARLQGHQDERRLYTQSYSASSISASLGAAYYLTSFLSLSGELKWINSFTIDVEPQELKIASLKDYIVARRDPYSITISAMSALLTLRLHLL